MQISMHMYISVLINLEGTESNITSLLTQAQSHRIISDPPSSWDPCWC